MNRQFALLLLALAAAGPASAQSLMFENVSLSGGQVTFTIQNTGPSTSFRLESSPSMTTGNWSPVAASFTSTGAGGLFSATIPRPAETTLFFRVIGLSGTAEDPDGDGLASTFETTGWRIGGAGPLYTSDPGVFDTDDDGFSDGVEFAYGTNPRSAASKPDQATLPAIEFAKPNSSANEEDGSFPVTLQFSAPYSGAVTYTVNTRTTATAQDFTTTGSVAVSGTSGSITIVLDDDMVVEGERLIILDLDADPPGGGYRRGGRSSHVICLSDNDSYWSGSLDDGASERNFRLRVLREGAATTVAFVAGAADGLTAPAGVGGSQSEGIIPVAPQEVWSATGVLDNAARFRVISPLMPVGSGGMIETPADLRRTLTLDATNANFIGERVISGAYTDVVASSLVPPKTYLNRTRTGTFALIRDVPAPPDVDSAFQP